MARRYTDTDLAKIRVAQGENIPIPKERKKPSREESIIQQNVIRWWRVVHHSFGCAEILLFSVPNGGFRHVITAAILKAEGARKGVADLFLAVPRRGIPGLFIEMKRPKGVRSPEQIAFLAAVSQQGYDARCCYSYDEAVATITAYLTIK